MNDIKKNVQILLIDHTEAEFTDVTFGGFSLGVEKCSVYANISQNLEA